MTETMCTSGAVKLKAGFNVSTDLTAAHYTELINQAESFINVTTRINYTDSYSGLNADVQKLLQSAAAAHAAMGAINYDMSNFTSRAEAQTMLDVNYTILNDAIKLLKEKKHTDFIDGA